MKISFIIPHYNNKELLDECLTSIYNSEGIEEKEIIVVDDASTDGSKEFITKRHGDIIWIRNSDNQGFAKSTNRGVGFSGKGLIFLLNNDVTLFPDTVLKLFELLNHSSNAGAVAPISYYPDGRLQISCRRFPSPSAIILEKLHISHLGPFRKWKLLPKEHMEGTEVLQPMAAALLIRRRCWEEVGELDERFPIFFNDVDWCYRLYKLKSYKIYLSAQARILHHEGATINKLGFRKKIEFYRGLFNFYKKHWL